MRLSNVAIAGALALAAGLSGATAAEADQHKLDEAVRLGTVAALAPLCGFREEAWAFDLRRAAIQETTGSAPDDPALEQAPGSNMVVGALSFAEAEALEDFAQAAPAETCGPLRTSQDLARADGMVDRFRAMIRNLKTGS